MDAAPFYVLHTDFQPSLFIIHNKTIVLTINRRTKNDTVFYNFRIHNINVDSLFNIFFYGTNNTSYCSPQMEQRYQIYFIMAGFKMTKQSNIQC